MLAPIEAAPAVTPGSVQIRLLDRTTEYAAAADLLASIWGTGSDAPPLAGDVLASLHHAGGCVIGAMIGPRLVGVAVAVAGAPRSAAVYGLIAGVAKDVAGRGVGFRLKLAQREWALERDADTMYWTFDPLIRRNAHFNIVRLGAQITEYLPDFYPPMQDAINRDDDTDRLVARWDLTSQAAGRRERSRGTVTLEVGVDGDPVPHPARARGACRVMTPPDIESLRVTNPTMAAAWRSAQRRAFQDAFGQAMVVEGFTADGAYQLAETTKEIPLP